MMPSGWTLKKIGDVCSTKSGGTPSRSRPEYYGGTIPWVKSGEVNKVRITDTEERITLAAIDNSSAKIIPKGTVVAAMYGATAGKVGFLEIDAALNQAVLAITPKENELASVYVFHLLTDLLPKKLSLAQGGQANLSAEIIKDLCILIPPIAEQEKIAKILSTWDEAIEKLENIISNLEKIKSNQLSSLILKCNKSIRSTTLGSVAELINGRAYKQSEWEDAGIPVIRLQNLTGTGDKFYYSTLELPEDKYCHRDDILFMWSASFGPYIWQGPKAIFHYHIWKVVPKVEQIEKSYLYYLLLAYTELWKRNTNGSTMAHLTKGSMEKVSVPLPDFTYQKQISTYFSSLDKMILIQNNILKRLKIQKQGLMQQLLTGKKRVRI